MALKTGDWVEVRSKEEILATLDADARTQGMPFMPQMLQYCGKRFQVYKRAHKTCDPTRHANLCALPDAVHLNLRCDGKAYDGCQAACLLFWKEAWLKPVSDGASVASTRPRYDAICTEADIHRATCVTGDDGKVERYFCQATEVPRYTTHLPWWDVRQYVEDYTSRNTTLWRMFRALVYAYVGRPFARRFSVCERAYDRLQAMWGGIPFPRKKGKLPLEVSAPMAELDLQPGELVRVKPYQEILATCNVHNHNRGMLFDAEMVPYCGRVFRVRARVERFVDEQNGRPRTLKTPAVILEGVWCQSRYSECRMHCPRAIYSWWREIWLERVSEAPKRAAKTEGGHPVQGPRTADPLAASGKAAFSPLEPGKRCEPAVPATCDSA